MKSFSIIVAIAENYAIGKDNQLLWHIPEKSQTREGLLPTPTKTGSEHRTQYSQGGRPLMYMLERGLLPTPTASTNYEPSKEGCWERDKTCGYILGVKVAKAVGMTKQESIGKKLLLHPLFVEWMMGFPIGWTD